MFLSFFLSFFFLFLIYYSHYKYIRDNIETHGLEFLLKLNTGMERTKKFFMANKPSAVITYMVKNGVKRF